MHAVLSLCCLLAQASGLQLGQLRPTCTSVRAAGPIAGLFDMFQETEEQRLAKEREKEEQVCPAAALQLDGLGAALQPMVAAHSLPTLM